MWDEAWMIRYELLANGQLVSFRILREEVLTAPADDAEFGMRVSLKFIPKEGEEDLEEDDFAEDTAEWGSLGFMFLLARLSFDDARPRNASVIQYQDEDDFKPIDFIERLRFVQGELHYDADCIRGRRIKTRIAARSNGTVTLETVGRGKSAIRWLERIRLKRLLRPVDQQP